MNDEKPNWWVEPIDPKNIHHGCLNCGGPHQSAPMEMLIAVGFESAAVTKGGETVYYEDHRDWSKDWTVADAEKAALEDPDHDWRITMFGPLHGETYQRHGPGEWVMIESNMGFA